MVLKSLFLAKDLQKSPSGWGRSPQNPTKNKNTIKLHPFVQIATNFLTFGSSLPPLVKSFLLKDQLFFSAYSRLLRSVSLLQTRDGNRSGQPARVGLPVGSRFFDRPVKPVEKPVKFSFLATKRHLSANRNILIYFIIDRTFYKKNSINKPLPSKTLVEWFQAVTNML